MRKQADRHSARFVRLVATIAWLLIGAMGMPAIAQARDAPLSREQKLAIAQTVYDRLVRSIGDGRPAPRLRLRSNIQVAMYVPDKREIDLDEKAIDLCLALPDSDAALAVLLGHELAHYYGHHGWTAEFGNTLDADLKDRIKSITGEDRLRCEMEADYYGGFYGYMAGYDTLGAAPRLIESIYQHYDQMPGYPSMREREDISRQAESKLEQLVPIFDAGNLLLELRQYPEAIVCFDRIAKDFPSREILSNAGVAQAQYAMMLLGDAGGGWVYPFQLDADTRLHSPAVVSRGTLTDDQKRKIRAQLIEAERCFEQAKAADPAYVPAYLNLAGAYDLLGEAGLARAFAEKAQSLAQAQGNPLTIAASKIMIGIIQAHAGKQDQAKILFLAAQDVYPDIVAANLAALAGATTQPGAINVPGAVTTILTTQPATRPVVETILGASPEQDGVLDEAPYQTVKISTFNEDAPTLTVRQKITADWIGYRITTDESQISVFSVRARSTATTARGVRIGSSDADVRAAYGTPQSVIAARQCTFYRYDSGRIIFQINPDGRVAGWSIFSIQ